MTALFRIMKHELRIMVFVFFSMILASLFMIHPVFAQTPSTSKESQTKPYTLTPLPSSVSPTSPLYTDLILNNLFHSFSCLAVGQSVIGQPCLTYQVTKNAQGAIQSVPMLSQVNLSGGTLGAVTGVIGMLYQNPPVRTADYLASVGQDLGIVKVAHAQVTGSGAVVLNPILGLWQVSRNISYVIMILIFIIIGLMVMFRTKINPQTVISAQAALPGLVVGLILITFSYFLAGLVSDMAFVGTNVVGYYFTAAQGKLADPTRLNLAQRLSGTNILNLMGSLTGIVDSGDIQNFGVTIYDSLGDEAKKAIGTLVFWISTQFTSGLVPDDLLAGSTKFNPWSLLLKPIVGLIGGLISNALLFPILGQVLSLAAALALVYTMLKLFFKLITAWLTIIFLTISAPFQFLFASLPGRQGIATGWILNMLGNILIFPAVIAVIYFVAFLLGTRFTAYCLKDITGTCLIQVSNSNQINNGTFVPPVYAKDGKNVIDSGAFPLFGGMNLDFVKILLAFGALMALPTIPDIIVRSVGKAGQAGQMIGQEIAGGARFGQGYSQKSFQAGLGVGQQAKTGLTGETQTDSSGTLRVVRGGLLRPVPGAVTVKPATYAKAGKYFWQK